MNWYKQAQYYDKDDPKADTVNFPMYSREDGEVPYPVMGGPLEDDMDVPDMVFGNDMTTYFQGLSLLIDHPLFGQVVRYYKEKKSPWGDITSSELSTQAGIPQEYTQKLMLLTHQFKGRPLQSVAVPLRQHAKEKRIERERSMLNR